jgi:histidinol-phosphate aminotransferase
MTEEKKDTDTTPTGLASKLARPNILSLQPYRCARDDYDSGILLDANENAYGPASLPTNSLNPYDNGMELERYPCPYQRGIKRLLCDYRNKQTNASIKEDNVFVGVGSDEAIDLLIRIFCTPGHTAGSGDAIMITPPTYGMYNVCANTNDVGIQSVPLTPEFDVRVEEVLNAVNEKTKLLFLCSPGNPTSKSIPLETVKLIASSNRYGGFIVVDEAYVDFASETSATSLVCEYNNIIVLQTLSKAFGLAGIRCGFAIGPPDVIQLMNNVKAPYNVNKLTSDAATNAMKNTDVLEKHVKGVLEQREMVAKELEGLDFVEKVYPSDANFLLFRVKQKAYELYKTVSVWCLCCIDVFLMNSSDLHVLNKCYIKLNCYRWLTGESFLVSEEMNCTAMNASGSQLVCQRKMLSFWSC